jgi:hypothetical protein
MRAVKISDPDEYGVIRYKYHFPVRKHHVHYLDELQLPPNNIMRAKFTKDLRKLSYKYSFEYCLNPRIFAFLITWQRMGSFIIDEEDPVTIEIINFLRDLARNEVALSTDPIPKGSILGAALFALGLDQEYTLTDDSVKE